MRAVSYGARYVRSLLTIGGHMLRVPTVADSATRAMYRRNILTVFDQATHRQQGKGNAWYPEAYEFACDLDPGNPSRAAGVIAALSANKSWRENVTLAIDAYNGQRIRHVANARSKVSLIMSGTDPTRVLPMNMKTGNFYLCINDPAHPTAVCIDRHAHDIALGVVMGNQDRGLSSPSRYALLADSYRDAACDVGLRPLVLQAITWTVWREFIAGKGTRPMF